MSQISIIKHGQSRTDIVKIGRWTHVDVCENCEHVLSHDEEYHAGGICAHCGYDSHSTICDSIAVIYRKLYTFVPKWWEFWLEPQYVIEPKNAASEAILLKHPIDG